MKANEIAERLYDAVYLKSEKFIIEEARIGLGYVGIKLEESFMGLSALLYHELSPSCTAFPNAGSLAGSRASTLLKFLIEGSNPLEKAIGLATANALIHPVTFNEQTDAISIMGLKPEDHVAMVGHFAPLVKKIKDKGAKLSIIERNPAQKGFIEKKDIDRILKECTVAIITATTILNNTIEYILERLGNPRHVVLLGPSTPLYPEIFQETPIGHLGGAVVIDSKRIMQVISEGGGTTAMRPYLKFINLKVY